MIANFINVLQLAKWVRQLMPPTVNLFPIKNFKFEDHIYAKVDLKNMVDYIFLQSNAFVVAKIKFSTTTYRYFSITFHKVSCINAFVNNPKVCTYLIYL